MVNVNYALNPRKCEFMGFGKTSENKLFTCHEIQFEKTTTKKLTSIIIDKHLNLNEHLTNVCKSDSRKLNELSLLSYQQKKVVSNSFISRQFSYCPLIWMFSSIRSYSTKTNYDKFLSKQNLVKIHTRNMLQLMIKIFKYLKGISPPIVNEIFRLRNISYTTRNPRDLNSWLRKTVYCGLETISYKRPQSW